MYYQENQYKENVGNFLTLLIHKFQYLVFLVYSQWTLLQELCAKENEKVSTVDSRYLDLAYLE